MEKEKLLGNTSERAEIIVDYKKGDIDIKSVYDDNLYCRLTSAIGEWFGYILTLFVILIIINQFILKGIIQNNYIVGIILIIYSIILLLHINKNFDNKVKKYFARRSGKGERNRILAKNINSKEFVLWDIKNKIVDFKVTGDISNKLSKIWIKKEKYISLCNNQADIKDSYKVDDKDIWNVHFYFEEIPKDGELHIEWI